MSLTLGREGGIAKPLKKQTVGQINIAHVYDGANHIWPTSVIHFSDFTSVQLRYIWGSDDGRDLNTKSYYVNSPINSLNYVAVGWSWNLSQIPYLYWGGDNTDSGAECVIPEGYNGAGMNYDGGNRRDVNGKANAGLTLGIIGTALGAWALFGNRRSAGASILGGAGGGMLGDGSTNINVLGATAGSGSGAPTAFQAWENLVKIL